MDERIRKYFEEKLSQSERLDFLREIDTDDSLRKDFIEYRNIFGLISLTERPEDRYEGEINYKYFVDENKSKAKRKLFVRIGKYAAAVVALVVLSWYASFYYNQTDSNIYAETTNTLSVPAGQRASITLCDGTEVWLNAKSTLIYPSQFKKGERRVKLIGEAYFEVAKDSDNPFIVSTSTIDVKVLGTTFNVKDYVEADSTSVSLIEGIVEVYTPDKVLEKITLKPNERLSFKNDMMHITAFNGDNDFLWRDGIYAFEKAPLSEIVKQLELYYDTKIIIKNPAIANNRYTGKFRQRDGVLEIFRIIQKIHKFKIKKDEVNNIIILE